MENPNSNQNQTEDEELDILGEKSTLMATLKLPKYQQGPIRSVYFVVMKTANKTPRSFVSLTNFSELADHFSRVSPYK